jgi:hypothetical protein
MLLGLATFGRAAAGATATAPVPAPSKDFCTAFSDWYTAQFLIALVGGFAQIGAGKGVDEHEVRATYTLALSPKLLEITRDLRRAAPAVLRGDLAEQIRVYQQGIEMLRAAGVPPRVIRAVAAFDMNSDSGDFDVDKEVGVSSKKLKAAGRRFQTVGKRVLEWHPPRAAAAFLQRAANECGVVPDSSVQCRDLFSDAEAAGLLGDSPTLDDGQGCVWETSDQGGVNASTLEVDVYASGMPYQVFAERHDGGEAVPGVGEAATTVSGFISSGTTKSCGRTLVAQAGDRTVQLALCLGDPEVATDQVRAVADQVLGRL